MIVPCPHCGKPVVVKGLGRKPLRIPLKNIRDSLQAQQNVKTAAKELGCSPTYVFQVLKVNGLLLRDVLKKKRNIIGHYVEQMDGG